MNPSEAARLEPHGFANLGGFPTPVRDDNDEDGTIFPSFHLFDFDSYRALNVVQLVPDVRLGELDGPIRFEEAAAIWGMTDDDEEMAHQATSFSAICKLYRLQRAVATLQRTQLAVLERFTGGTDKATVLLDERTVVFKYKATAPPYGGIWGEIQILAQLPSTHPHLLPLECLVLEETSGLGVVGFTLRYVAGPSLDRWDLSRPFKLRWLRELMTVVDELNLEYGIVHQDIADRNLLVDPDTGSLVLLDFGIATGIGHHCPRKGYLHELPARNDVKGVVVLAYFLVTRNPRYKLYCLDHIDEASLHDVTKWTEGAAAQHVALDHPPATFYAEVTAWAARRRAATPQLTHYTQAPRHLSLPPPPVPPEDEGVLTRKDGSSYTAPLIEISGCRAQRVAAGRPVLRWERPPAAKVDKSRRLLATGRYEDEETAGDAPGLAVPDSKRGFPQPPVVGAGAGVGGGGGDRVGGGHARGVNGGEEGRGVGDVELKMDGEGGRKRRRKDMT